MSLSVRIDHEAIGAAIDRWVVADPVRATSLGSIRDVLEDTAWAALDDERSVESVHAIATLLQPAMTQKRGCTGQRLFRCDELIAPADVPGSAVAAALDQRELVRRWFVDFMVESDETFGQPDQAADRALERNTCWLWTTSDGETVSLAAQRRPVAGSARIGPVYTPPSQRGRGYGSAVTAAATRAIIDAGAVPVLFTDLANPTSNKIYQQLGYRPVEDRAVAVFRRPTAT